jgi:hypothetical protein
MGDNFMRRSCASFIPGQILSGWLSWGGEIGEAC